MDRNPDRSCPQHSIRSRYHPSKRTMDPPMPWLKALHVISVITWFAGLFYLPRLFVYHADTHDKISLDRFVVMERRLFVIMTIGATAGLFFGASMLVESTAYLAFLWLRVKLLFVLLV